MAIITYKKGTATRVSDEYVSTDFDCPCVAPECTETLIDELLVKGLDLMCLSFPILRIDSGYRCAPHNTAVGGAAHSQHLLGKGADVSTSFGSVADMEKAAEKIECFANGGIGVYDDGHLHVDTRGTRARWIGGKI